MHKFGAQHLEFGRNAATRACISLGFFTVVEVSGVREAKAEVVL
jgi:hypothetical protein